MIARSVLLLIAMALVTVAMAGSLITGEGHWPIPVAVILGAVLVAAATVKRMSDHSQTQR